MISDHDAWRLRRSGFTYKEIADFAWAVDQAGKDQVIDIDTEPWQKAMRRRRSLRRRIATRFWEEMGRKPYTYRVDDIIDSFDIDPWEWIRLEYKHGKKPSDKAAAARAMKRTARMRRYATG